MEITNSSAFEIWKEGLSNIMKNGLDYNDNDGRLCREVMNLIIVLKDPANSLIEKPIKKMSGSNKWIYPSKGELSNIMFKEIQAPIYEYTYGGRLFNFSGKFDQLNNFVIPLLTNDPGSRRAILSFYDPVQDSNINNRNTPGIMYVQFRIIKGELQLTALIRSNDLLFGWPANIYQLYSLQKMVAEKLSIKQGDLITISNSAHIFSDEFSFVEELLIK